MTRLSRRRSNVLTRELSISKFAMSIETGDTPLAPLMQRALGLLANLWGEVGLIFATN